MIGRIKEKESTIVSGSIIALAATLLKEFGGFSATEAESLILGLIQVASIMLIWYDRVSKGDVSIFGWRNK